MAEHLAQSITRDELKADDEARLKLITARLEQGDDFDPQGYTPPGPVGEAFLNAPEATAIIMGPVGGGKTTLCVFKRFLLATAAPIAWHPEDKKPTRMCRWVVVRDTWRSAERTVLKSWQQWFPKNYPGSSSEGGNDRPFKHTLRFIGEDGIRIEAITEFQGLNSQSISEVLKGSEYSGGWLNETDTHADGALDELEQRLGRYPAPNILLTKDEVAELSRRMGHPLHSGERLASAIGDMNAPTIDNWTYKTLVTNRAPGRGFYIQPSGRTPQAENRFNLPDDYYQRIVENQDEHYVRRMVDNQFGYSRAGKPVHPSFDHRRHVAGEIIPFRPQLPLLVGIDASTNALTPAAVLGQVLPNGRLAVIDELAFDHGYGPSRFGEALKRRLDEKYHQRSSIRGWADPASQYGGDRDAGQLAAMDILSVILGFPLELPFGGSNEIALRLDAVNVELRGYTDADTSLLISPNCTQVIEAIAGRYRFKKRSETASTEYEDAPEKTHPWSDLMDALQYLSGGVRGRTAIMKALTGGSHLANGSRSGWGGKAEAAKSKGGFDPHNF